MIGRLRPPTHGTFLYGEKIKRRASPVIFLPGIAKRLARNNSLLPRRIGYINTP